MILIADGGSTKTEWKIISRGIPQESYFTSGINPFFLTGEEVYLLLKKELDSLSGKSFSKVFFYGTGCNSVSKENIIKGAIEKFFSPGEIFVGSDLLGAARSLCQNDPGIACIMGTGSNSCYYNGSVIVSNVSPLGYILGDEGGGAVIGRKLVSGVLKKQVNQKVIDCFFETYKLTPAEILENVYTKPFPNKFLGQFAEFIASNIDIPELQDIIKSCFDDFIKRNILQYPEAKVFPIHFTGSIAYYFRPFLEDLLTRNNLKSGIITLSPMENLMKYHISKI
ncbi:MAG: ATPase [Bacteroidales bacterium]